MSVYYLFFILGIVSSNCERLHEQIYSSIEGGSACFRRLNGTHTTGCSSGDNGAVGVVQIIREMSDAQWLVYNSTAGPYMAIVSASLFSEIIELLMGHPQNVAGVLMYEDTSHSASAFTQESRCPNEYSSDQTLKNCSSSQAGGLVWNEKGTGLLQRNIPFPIFFLPKTRSVEIDKIEECFQKFNLDKDNQKGMPLCSVQMNSFMFASVNSEVCMRRSASSTFLSSTKVCDPLRNQNVYYTLFPRKQEEGQKESVTLVTARIDTASLFDGVSPGAASSVVGMVTLLTTAVTLSKLIPITDAHLYEQNILFTLFNGEAFDYIGSQRVAYDLSKGMWPPGAPLSPTDIKLHVEVGQIGGALSAFSNVSTWPLHAFAPYEDVVTEITEFIGLMSPIAEQYNISVEPKFSTYLPPSSLHSFRRILSNVTKNQLPEMLLTDHESAFTNMFYHSVLDDYDKIGFVYRNISIGSDGTFLTTEELLANGTMKNTDAQVKISSLATALARTLYQKVVGVAYQGNFSASAHMVDEMLFCFLRSQSCRLLLAADYASSSATGTEEAVSESPAPLYVGVATWATTAPVFAGHLLALLAGNVMNENKTACNAFQQPGFTYYWLKGWNHTGVCIQTTMNFSQAMSPAFIIADYEMSSGLYSTWTESVWLSMSMRVFVSAGGAGSRVAAATGAAATLFATLITFWLRRHKDRLFDNNTARVTRDDATSGILRTVNC